MAKLIYSGIMSLDGYVADEEGSFDWGAPDPEVHQFVNELERPIGTYLYGRRMYDVMSPWETAAGPEAPSHLRDYGEIWRSADKIVYSTSLPRVSTARTRLERTFDVDAVRSLKSGSERDFSIGGSELAGHAVRAGLVDEYHLFLTPIVVGGGTRFLPDHVRLQLELLDQRHFANGVVHLHYAQLSALRTTT
jgi:dihydrofolate reductase